MKRVVILCTLLILAVFQTIQAASDLNVMDDIGFNSAYGYYKSANETINVQSGNVILEIPVSPVYPGPEGSGLDLQLKMIYNSQSWRYKGNDRTQIPSGTERFNLYSILITSNIGYR